MSILGVVVIVTVTAVILRYEIKFGGLAFFVLAALMLSGCAVSAVPIRSESVTDGMMAAMRDAANEFATTDLSNPTALNVAHECRQHQNGLYWNANIDWYAVTCKIESVDGFGVVLIDAADGIVVNTMTLNQVSESDLDDLLSKIGYVK